MPKYMYCVGNPMPALKKRSFLERSHPPQVERKASDVSDKEVAASYELPHVVRVFSEEKDAESYAAVLNSAEIGTDTRKLHIRAVFKIKADMAEAKVAADDASARSYDLPSLKILDMVSASVLGREHILQSKEKQKYDAIWAAGEQDTVLKKLTDMIAAYKIHRDVLGKHISSKHDADATAFFEAINSGRVVGKEAMLASARGELAKLDAKDHKNHYAALLRVFHDNLIAMTPAPVLDAVPAPTPVRAFA